MLKRTLALALCAALLLQLAGCAIVLNVPSSPAADSATTESSAHTGPAEEDPDSTADSTGTSAEATEGTPAPTEEPATPTENTTSTQITEPSQGSADTAKPTAPMETQPESTNAPDEYIGSLYTRSQLEALDTTRMIYASGSEVDKSNRPVKAAAFQAQYGKYETFSIAPDNGKIYLSIDIYMSLINYPHIINNILDTLKEKDVKATFYLGYDIFQDPPELVQRIINDGHSLVSCIRIISENDTIDAIVSEIQSVHNYVLNTYGYEMTLLRPDFGNYSEQLLAISQSLGYKTILWSAAYRGSSAEPSEALKAATDRIHSGAIYSLHITDDSPNAEILGDLIDSARAKGLEFELFQ